MAATEPQKSGVLVLGTGELGMSIIKSLLSQPAVRSSKVTITVLLRPNTVSTPSAKLTTLKALGVSYLGIDLDSTTSDELIDTFLPFHTIIAANGASASSTLLKVVDAVFAASTPLFFPWQFGVDYDLVGLGSPAQIWDVQYQIRQKLREHSAAGGKTSWVIVSTGLFMSMLFMPEFGIIEPLNDGAERKVIVRALGSWDTRVTVTDVDDIGKCVSSIYDETVHNGLSSGGKIVYLAGESLSYGAIAERVERALSEVALQTKLEREVWTLDTLLHDIEGGADDTVRYRAAFAAGKGTSWDSEQTWNTNRGISMLNVEGYAKKHFGS